MSDTVMNATSLAISAVALVSLYDVCAKGCKFVSRAKSTSRKAQESLSNIETQRCRLKIWARERGLRAENPNLTRLEHDLNISDVRQIIHNSLTSIENNVCEIDTLRDKYGLAFDDIHAPSGAETLPVTFSGDPVHHPAITASKDSWEARIAERSGRLSKMLKASYSFTDEAKLDELTDTLTRHVNDLWNTMMSDRLAQIERQLSTEVLAGARQQASLHVLLRTSNDPTIRRHAGNQIASRQLDDRLDQTEGVQRHQRKISLFTLKLPSSIDTDAPRATGDLKRGNGRGQARVLVEWKKGPWAEDEVRMEARVDNLAIMLGRMKAGTGGESYRVLTCEGYFEHTEKHTFGIVYSFPKHADPLRMPVSLYDILTKNSQYLSAVPSLDARLELSKHLVISLNELHCSGWLHKQISSKSIIFFWPEAAPGQERAPAVFPEESLNHPYIVSFDLSRPTKDAWGTEEKSAASGKTMDLRRHPDQNANRSARRHDIYSLGLVLLEIGQWKRLEDMVRPEECGSFHEKAPSQAEILGFQVGKTYRAVVDKMLRSVKEDKYTWRESSTVLPGEHKVMHETNSAEAAESKMMLDFYYDVVDKLVCIARPIILLFRPVA